MTDASPSGAGPAADDPADPARRIRAVAAELTGAGLTTHLHETRAALDVTATLHRPGRKDAEVIVDEDGYVEIRYWNNPGATPAQITATISRALAVITTMW
jgi:hypothetical protein